MFDIPVKGTHAHSWVMLFEDELEAFIAYGEAMPHNCVFLVDTYNSLQGVQRAVQRCERHENAPTPNRHPAKRMISTQADHR